MSDYFTGCEVCEANARTYGVMTAECKVDELEEEVARLRAEVYKPIADTYELDRAVQVKIAEAFGELLGHLRIASAAEPLADISPLCAIHRAEGLKRFARILHTAMGGRIPDEVP